MVMSYLNMSSILAIPLLQHRSDTGNARPIRQGFRRHPQVYLDVIDERVESILTGRHHRTSELAVN